MLHSRHVCVCVVRASRRPAVHRHHDSAPAGAATRAAPGAAVRAAAHSVGARLAASSRVPAEGAPAARGRPTHTPRAAHRPRTRVRINDAGCANRHPAGGRAASRACQRHPLGGRKREALAAGVSWSAALPLRPPRQYRLVQPASKTSDRTRLALLVVASARQRPPTTARRAARSPPSGVAAERTAAPTPHRPRASPSLTHQVPHATEARPVAQAASRKPTKTREFPGGAHTLRAPPSSGQCSRRHSPIVDVGEKSYQERGQVGLLRRGRAAGAAWLGHLR